MSFKAFIKNLLAFLKDLFGDKKETTTVQPSTTTTKPATTYASINVTNEGKPVIEGGRRYYLDPEEISYMITLEPNLAVKSEIRNLVREKEAAGINIYSFETDLGRYEVTNGSFIRYPKTN